MLFPNNIPFFTVEIGSDSNLSPDSLSPSPNWQHAPLGFGKPAYKRANQLAVRSASQSILYSPFLFLYMQNTVLGLC